MGAYSLPIERPRCRTCGSRATEHVFNTYNAPAGYYCKTHAKRAVDELNGVVYRRAPLIVPRKED